MRTALATTTYTNARYQHSSAPLFCLMQYSSKRSSLIARLISWQMLDAITAHANNFLINEFRIIVLLLTWFGCIADRLTTSYTTLFIHKQQPAVPRHPKNGNMTRRSRILTTRNSFI